MSDSLWDAIPPEASRVDQQLAQVRWEETIVGRLLKFYGQSHMAPALRKCCADLTGHSRLLFCWFHDQFPTFPVWLVFRKVRYLHKVTFEDFLGRFSKSPVWQAYHEARENAPGPWLRAGRPVAMVFEHIHGFGAAVCTDCERPLGEDNTRIVKNFRGVNYYFEALDEFLAGLGWSPN